MSALGVLISTLLNTAIIGLFARRLLGVPVGWPRTLVISLIVNSAAAPLSGWALERAGVPWPSTATTTADRAVIFAVVALLIAWLLAAEVGVLAIGETLVPTGSLPGPLEWLRSLPGRWRRSRRYAAILTIATRHGLGGYLTARGHRRTATGRRDTAVALREALTDGGVTFVKLGQMLSTRPDLVPQAYVDELSRLHSNVPPEPWERARATLQEELGADPDALFAEIEHEPLAAASVGQVYRGRLVTGEPVVVKVQRSDARRTVTGDLDIVQRLAASLERRAGWARNLGTEALANGFKAALEEELDYRVELRNLSAVQGGEQVVVPTAYAAVSTRRVITMDLLDGTLLSQAQEQIALLDPARRAELAETLMDVVLAQILVHGVFHADLHGGNVMLLADGRLALLDFGSVGRMDRSMRTAMVLLLHAVDRQDGPAATAALVDLLGAPRDFDERLLERQVSDLVMRFGHGAQTDELFGDLFASVLACGLSVPSPVAAAFRAIGALEGTLRLLAPDTDVIELARRRAASALNLTPEALASAVRDQFTATLPLMERLPRRVMSIVDDLHAGQFAVTVRGLQDVREQRFLTGLVHQVVLAVLAATAAACGVALTLSEAGPMLSDRLRLTTYFGLVLLLFAFILGSRAVALVFRSRFEADRDPR